MEHYWRHRSHYWVERTVTADGCIEFHCKYCWLDEYDEQAREPCKKGKPFELSGKPLR